MRVLLLGALLLAPLKLAAAEGCSLGGIVVNSLTREPVPRAQVYARPLNTPGSAGRALGITTTTDGAGRFAFTALEPGRYALSAERSGFVTSNYGQPRPGRAPVPLEIAEAQAIQDLILPIVPHGVISGRVVDEEGEPVVGAQVQVSTIGYQNGHRQFTRTSNAPTNDLGEYRAYGLAPGKYYVSVLAAGNLFAGMTAQKPAEDDYVTTYYPRTTDPTNATPVPITPGAQVRGIDLRLTRVRTASVRGRVTTEGLPAGTNVSVMMLPTASIASNAMKPGRVGAGGAFEIDGVTPGSWVLVASANRMGKGVSTRMSLQVGAAAVEGVEIAVRGGVLLEGTIRVEGADPADFAHWQVFLRPADIGGTSFGTLGGTKVTSGGTFRMEEVGTERYLVYLSGMPPGFYVASVRSGQTDVLVHGLQTGGAQPEPLQIVVRPNAGQIAGVAMDRQSGQPAANVAIVVAPDESDRREATQLYATAVTDPSGHFTVKGLVPGEYRVFAFEDIEYTAWLDPEYMKPFLAKGERITVREGGPQTVQVNVVPADAQ